MDPLFERRKLSKKVHIPSKYLQKNIQASILSQLKLNYEGKCSAEGFIQSNSITIVNYSLGRANYLRGGIDYDVEFQADICMPHAGQRFKAQTKVKSKIGIHAETPPIKVLIPRDLHLGNADFDNIKMGEDIEFEVIGTQFKQQDTDIIIVGKMLTKIAPEPLAPLSTALPAEEITEKPVLSVSSAPAGEEKQVVITAPPGEAPKKRKLKRGGDDNNNGVLSI